MTTRVLSAVGALVFLVASACSPLAPIPDRSRYYALMPAPAPPTSQAAGEPGRPRALCALGPVTLPAYLDRTQIVTRLSPTEVAYSEWDRWAEPLGTSVAAALRDSIAAELGNDRLVTYPWSAVDVDYQIEVAFVRFETQSNGDTQMAARWSVRDVHRAMEVIRRETTRAQKVAPHDRAASTAALSTMLSDLGHEIAEAVRDLPPAPPRKTATK